MLKIEIKDVQDLSIPARFLEKLPKAEKIEAKRKLFCTTGELPPVIITPTGCVIDGYTCLLVQLEHGITDIKCIVTPATKSYGRVVPVSEMPEFTALATGRVSLERFNTKRHTAYVDSDVFSSALTTLVEQQQNRCYICGRVMDRRPSDGEPMTANTATLDHIVPRALGGASILENLAASCHRCNQLKGQLVFSEELSRIIIAQRQHEDSLVNAGSVMVYD